jgi:RNA polymerase sigma factor (sigma-70 family)
MDSPTGHAASDFLEAQRCLGGDAAALGGLRERCHGTLRAILQARGATPTEAEDILADVWGDCVSDTDQKPSLLGKYSGKCALQSWLATVATNRWHDKKRKDSRMSELTPPESDPSREPVAADDVEKSIPSEDAIVALLRDALKAAFAACSPENKVCLRLVYLHGLSQREVSRMLGWIESKVSRALSSAMDQIASDTLSEIKRRDPWLKITWEDILELCQANQVGFL